ncbi:MAG: tetratricopeptide repeat protein [Bacteroidetes bacterium]|nr:tetratricopeptide repeat protein [Bacteroidota bacterium]
MPYYQLYFCPISKFFSIFIAINIKTNILTFLLCICICNTYFSAVNGKVIDSLKKVALTQKDTVKAKTFIIISTALEANYPNEALKYIDSSVTLLKPTNYLKLKISALRRLGGVLTTLGNYEKAISVLRDALTLNAELKSNSIYIGVYNTLGNTYLGLKRYDSALENYKLSLFYAQKSLKNKSDCAVAYIGIGNAYSNKNNLPKAIDNFKKAESIFKKANSKMYSAYVESLLGEVYVKNKKPTIALEYLLHSLIYFNESNDLYGSALTQENIGTAYIQLNNYSKAVTYFKNAYEINTKRNAWDNIMSSAEGLSKSYELLGDKTKALNYYKDYAKYKDSIYNKDRTRAFADVETKYETEKKEQELKIKNIELEKTSLKLSKRNTIMYYTLAILSIFLLMTIILYKQVRAKQKANTLLSHKNTEIEQKNLEIELKNKEILDSIKYAKRIQITQFPSAKYIKKHLNQ